MGNNYDSFILQIEETDLWIGISKGFLDKGLEKSLLKFLEEKRKILKDYIIKDPVFGSTLIPYHVKEGTPDFIQKMSKLSFLAGVGPMAGVAGAFSQLAGEYLKNKNIPEIIIENGGDIFTSGINEIKIGVFAGGSPFSNNISLEIELKQRDMGICSSSGAFGHSLSFGKADIVTIISENVITADLFATAVCNKIKKKEDIEEIINELKCVKEIEGALIILEDKLGAFGNFRIAGRN